MPKYRLLRGHHIQGDVTYNPGQIIETDKDLLKFNSTNSIRFERILEDSKPETIEELEAKLAKLKGSQPVVANPTTSSQTSTPTVKEPEDDGLDAMTVAQLRTFANEAGIDLLGVNKKEEIISVIRQQVG